MTFRFTRTAATTAVLCCLFSASIWAFQHPGTHASVASANAEAATASTDRLIVKCRSGTGAYKLLLAY